MNEDKERGHTISHKNEKYVWKLVFELLEKQMQQGLLTVVDATHTSIKDFKKYEKLCKQYKYRKYYVDFSDISIKECKERNSQREKVKIVPEDVIDRMYSKIKQREIPSGWTEIDRNKLVEEILFVSPSDFSGYSNIFIFGDIHGCFDPISEFFIKNPFSEDNFYIFSGDYIDRGIQNLEILNFLLSIKENKNVIEV